jgi:bifunctional non-homologous end joining protein LigD
VHPAQEFVIGGYTEPQGSRTGLGALLLGIHDERGRLRYAGNVGTGFDVKTLGALRKQLTKLETKDAPFIDKPREARGTWVEPKLVAEISFAEWTRDGKVRQAVFHGLRSRQAAQRDHARGRRAGTPAGRRRNSRRRVRATEAQRRLRRRRPALPKGLRRQPCPQRQRRRQRQQRQQSKTSPPPLPRRHRQQTHKANPHRHPLCPPR